MRYARCRCGRAEKYDSGLPDYPCEGCELCGTFASFYDGHKPLQPHELVALHDRLTGKTTGELYCNTCHRTFGKGAVA